MSGIHLQLGTHEPGEPYRKPANASLSKGPEGVLEASVQSVCMVTCPNTTTPYRAVRAWCMLPPAWRMFLPTWCMLPPAWRMFLHTWCMLSRTPCLSPHPLRSAPLVLPHLLLPALPSLPLSLLSSSLPFPSLLLYVMQADHPMNGQEENGIAAANGSSHSSRSTDEPTIQLPKHLEVSASAEATPLMRFSHLAEQITDAFILGTWRESHHS